MTDPISLSSPRAAGEPAAPSAALPVYLTPKQVAAMLQVNERTVLRWAQEDASMPVSRFGRVIRFERAALLRWLDRKRPRGTRLVAQAPTQGGRAMP